MLQVIHMWHLLSPRRRRPAILSLHDVVDANWFRSLVKGLASRAELVDLGTMVGQHTERTFGRPSLAITFDDGLKSIHTIVAPVCIDLGVPFTTFVCGDVLTGGPAPWYERVVHLAKHSGPLRASKYWGLEAHSIRSIPHLLSALKEVPLSELLRGLDAAEAREGVDARALRDRYMNVDELATVASHPLASVGSHTFRHPILSNLGPADQREEINRGIDAVRNVVPMCPFFAYPNGKLHDFDDNVIATLRAAGVRAAVTTLQRPISSEDDPMSLPRIGVSSGDSPSLVELKWALPWPSLGDRRELRWRRKVALARQV